MILWPWKGKLRNFRKYGIGYRDLSLFYAPKIHKKRSYIYTAIDRVAKIAFIMLGKSIEIKETGAKFLREALRFYPYKQNYILTDNGFEFSYKALPKNKKTKKVHPFFQSIFELNGKLLEFVDDYNQNKRLKSLSYKTPAQYLKETKGITLQRIVS